jgi:uncharacterized protein
MSAVGETPSRPHAGSRRPTAGFVTRAATRRTPARVAAALLLLLLGTTVPPAALAQMPNAGGQSMMPGRMTLPQLPVTPWEPDLMTGDSVANYARSCSAGTGRYCTALGIMHLRGQRVTRDEALALEFFQRGCEHADDLGCVLAAEHYLNANPNDARAAALLQRGCDLGTSRAPAAPRPSPDYLFSCTELAALYEQGAAGLARDETRAADLYQHGCDSGLGQACENLGALYARGADNLPQDPSRAAALYRQAADLYKHRCDRADMHACGQLALLYVRGDLPRDMQRAVQLLQRSCDGGQGDACSNLGVLYAQGAYDLSRDEKHAAALFRRGCDRGDAVACQDLKTLPAGH